MKKLICSLLSVCMLLSFCACSSGESAELTSNNDDYSDIAPVLGVEIENSENIGFYALTKNGTYSWEYTDKNGKTVYVEHDGYFCLDMESLCTFTREQTGGSITLKFTGSVTDYKIYQAPCEEIENDKTKILDDKYLVSTSSKTITFPENGEYYYVVNVNYDQGEVPYGFLLAE